MGKKKKIDNMIEGIKELAREDIRKIKEETDKKIDTLKEEFDKEKKGYREKKLAKFKREAELEAGQIITNQRLKSRNKILNEKRALIEGTLEEVVSRLKGLNKNNYSKFISSLINRVVLKGDEKISLSSLEKKLNSKDLEKIIKKINKVNNWQIETDKPSDRIDGGFILKGKDYETVVGWNNIREDIKSEYENKIIKELF